MKKEVTGEGLGQALLFLVALAAFAKGLSSDDGPRSTLVIGAILLAVVVVMQRDVIQARARRAAADTRGLPLVPWWVGVAVPGAFFAWASFAYVGLATRRARWLVWSAIYLAAFLGALVVVGDGDFPPELLATLLVGVWVVSIGHAAFINNEVEQRFRRRATPKKP